MDYDIFLSNYAFPAFGIALLIAILVWLPIYFWKGEPPTWMVWTVITLSLTSAASAIFIGAFLPWGSPF